MFKFLSRKLPTKTARKDARKTGKKSRRTGKGPAVTDAKSPSAEAGSAGNAESLASLEDEVVDSSGAAEKPVPVTQTPAADREELIQKAIRIRRAKSKLLDNLSPEDRKRLHDLAVKVLLGGEPGGGRRR